MLLSRSMHLTQGAVILTLGLGLGHDACALALQGYRIIGLDKDPASIWVSSHN